MRIAALTESQEISAQSFHELSRDGIACEFRVACDWQTFETMARWRRPDIVLTEVDSVHTSVSAVIGDIHRVVPDATLIAMGDRLVDPRCRAAVKAAGASFCLSASRMRRLPRLVRCAARRCDGSVRLESTSASKRDADSAQVYRELIEHSRSAFICWRPDRTVQFVNEFAGWFFGYSPAAFTGMDLACIFERKTGAAALNKLVDTLGQGADQLGPIQYQHRRGNGERAWMNWTHRALRTGDGRVTAVLSMGRDVSQRVETERQLRHERDRAQQYLDIAATIFVVIDRNQRIELINKRGCALLGRAESELIGKNWFDLCIPAEEREVVRAGFNQLLRGQGQLMKYYENAIVDASGAKRIIAWHNAVIHDEEGAIVATLSSGEDITERKAAARAMRESESRYRAIFDSTGTAMAILDEHGRIRLANEELSALSGYAHAELLGRQWSTLVGLRQARQLLLHFEREKGRPKSRKYEVVMRDRKSEPRYVLVHADELSDSSGYVVSLADITERRMAEESLRASERQLESAVNLLKRKNRALDDANAKLKDLDKLKTEFVSLASHELRTPLTGIIGFAETLLSEDIELSPDERKRYLNIIDSEGKRLGGLLSDLLDIAKIEKGEAAFALRTVEIREVLQHALERMHVPDRITARIEPSPALWVYADPQRISQVFANIIDNAVRHIDGQGAITVGFEDKGDVAQISIKDTGSGIRAEDQEKIFDTFYRSKYRRHVDKRSSSGLGLSIAKGVIESHGGAIWAESEPGRGATFYFTLRKRKRPDEQESAGNRG
jgi:PAS domain S-box-containing protein